MNAEKLIRFAFASRKRKLLTLVLAGTAGLSALLGGNSSNADPKVPSVGNPEVHARISALTDCSELQREFDNAERTSQRGGDWGKVGIAYMQAADARMKAVGCYGDTPSEDVYYASCAEAPGPLHAGDPGYRRGLDRNQDGVACE